MTAQTPTQKVKCVNEDCEELVSAARLALGYKDCLKCADKKPRKQYTVAPAYNKGAYQLILPSDVQHIGKK
jgi:hypothetical protein